MKKILSLLSLAALTVGLLGSCSKINERIDSLEKRIDGIESTSIASVQQQIDGIKASITKLEAADVTVNGKIDELKATAEAHQTLIDALKEADQALGQKDGELETRIATLEGQVAVIAGQIVALEDADKAINVRIDELKSYVDTEIGKAKDWATATFASLTEYEKTADDLAALSVTVTGIGTTLAGVQTSISGLGTKIDGINTTLQGKITSAKTELEGKITGLKTELEGKIATAISASETSIKTWVNELLEGYYTAAVVDAKIGSLNTVIEAAKGTAKTRIDSVATELTTLKTAVGTAKVAIRTEYKNAIDESINKLDGEIRGALLDSIAAVNGRIEALDTRVTDLESRVLAVEGNVNKLLAMIQSVTIVPAYNDGSVEATKDGVLYLDIIVSPAQAVAALTKDCLKVLVNEVKTKAVDVDTVAVTKFKVDAAKGTITARADISSKLPVENGKALTFAVNVRNGISDYTTEFYPVTLSTESNVTVKEETDTTKVTIKADEDFPESSAGNIVVADGFKDSKPTTVDIEVGGKGTVIFDAKATSQIKTNAKQAGATSVFFKVEDVTTTKPVENADVVLEVTMKTVDEKGTEVFNKDNAGKGAEVTIQIPIPEEKDVAFVNSVTLVNDAGEPISGGVVPGSEYFDKVKGILSFKVNHFSKYAIDYVTNDQFKAVTGVSIEPVSFTFQVGENYKLVANIAPEDATNKRVTWSSSDTTKVKVDDTGKITAVAFGKATITVTTVDGNKTADCAVKVSETKTMADILRTTTGIPESQNLTPPANAWVNSTDSDCKAFVGVDAEGDKLFVILKAGQELAPLGISMDDAFERIDDNTYQRIEPRVGTFTIKMTGGKFTSYEFAAVSGSAYEQFNGTYSAPVSSPTFKAVYNTNGGANTLTFYYDTNDHSREGTVYDNLPTAATTAADWGYNEKRGEIKSVVIDASVAGYKGLTSTAFMFQGMTEASSISGAEYLNVSNVTDMNYMFYLFGSNSSTLNTVPDVSEWDTGKVTNMTAMFHSYGKQSSTLDTVPDVSNWNTAEVKIMSNMFQDYGHESQNFNAVPDVSNWDTGNAEDTHQMFQEYGRKSTSLDAVPDVSNWNTGNVTNMNQMFYNYGIASTNISCVLDLSGWDLSNITGTNGVNVFKFNPKTFNVTIPAKTGEKSNEGDKWYYGNGTNHIAPPTDKTFTLPAAEPEYVEIGGVKWATKNLGAKKVTDSGDYFAWGETAPYYEGTGGRPATPTWKSGKESGYAWESYCGSSSFSEWSTPPYDATTKILKPEFDAAAQILGDGWRMPTSAEFQALFDACGGTETPKTGGSTSTTEKGVYWCTNYDGVAGCLFCDGTNKLFFPAAGHGDGTSLKNGSYGYYWSSSLYTVYTHSAYYLFFRSDGVYPQHNNTRCRGFSVRPVKAAAAGVSGNGTEQYNNNSNPDWFSK